MIAAVLVALATAAPQVKLMAPEPSFDAWCAKFGKCDVFADAERSAREAIYNDNVDFIQQHNVRYASGQETYFMGVNEYSAMTHKEFKAWFNLGNPIPQRNITDAPLLPVVHKLHGMADSSVDWRTKGAVTPIKNQGQCGSCWSFSTTGSIEGAVAIKTGKIPGAPLGLSEQQLMDCSKSYGNQGCSGGLMDNAFKYVIANGGLDSEEDYPYLTRNGVCDKSKEKEDVGTISSYKDVTMDSEQQMEAAVTLGPVSVAIEADQRAFQSYKGGVLNAACGDKLDHGVLVVGYTSDYWIVKNSWGATWGMEGYINMARGTSDPEGECGILRQASYPIAGAPGPMPPTPPSPPPPPPGPPSSGPYDDPTATGQCAMADEEAVQITGVSGKFCSPPCSLFKPCPQLSGVTAKGQCVLEVNGASKPTQCALICTPSADDDQCPGSATCKAISGTGICTYDS